MRLFHYLATNVTDMEEIEGKQEKHEKEWKDKTKKKREEERKEGAGAQAKTEKEILGSSAHTDWGLLTLIMQDEVGGLQYLDESINKDGRTIFNAQWRDVPSAAGAGSLVVNGGDFLKRVRPDLVSPVHRVV